MTLAIAKFDNALGARHPSLVATFFLGLSSVDIFRDDARHRIRKEQLPDKEDVLSSPAKKIDHSIASWKNTLAISQEVRSNSLNKLIQACHDGDFLAVNRFVEEKADLDCKDENFNTPLCIAARQGNEKCVSILSKCVRTLNQRGQKKRTPIHIAAIHGHQEIVKILALKGARLNVKDTNGSHCLDALNPEFVNQLRSDIQQSLNHLDGSSEHKALCKRFRSSVRAIDQYVQQQFNEMREKAK